MTETNTDTQVTPEEIRCVNPDGRLTHDPDTCQGPYCRFQYPTRHDQG